MIALPPPLLSDARAATQEALLPQAQLLDSRVMVGPCPRVGRSSRVCIGVIANRWGQRYRVIVTNASATTVVVRARPIKP